MAIIVIKHGEKLTKEDFEKSREEYHDYIKITVDIENKIVALGGKWHADAEIQVINNGGSRKNTWGGGINLDTGQIATDAMINIRAGINDSVEILNEETRNKFIKIAKEILHEYLHK